MTSLDGRNAVNIDSVQLTWSLARDGKRIIEPSPLGLKLDIRTIGRGARLVDQQQTTVNDIYEIVLGKARSAPDHYRQLALTFDASAAFKFQLLVGAYDNGVALRYVVPDQPSVKALSIKSEDTQFNFARDYECRTLRFFVGIIVKSGLPWISSIQLFRNLYE